MLDDVGPSLPHLLLDIILKSPQELVESCPAAEVAQEGLDDFLCLLVFHYTLTFHR